MLEKPFKKLAEIQERYPVLVILFVLTITIFFAYYAVRLETDSSFDVLFREDSDTRRLENLISNEFGSTDSVFVLIKIDETINDKTRIQDIRHPDVLKGMKDLTRALESETTIPSALSMVTLLETVYGRLPATLEESKHMIIGLPEDLKENYLSSLLNSDYTAMNLFVSINVENRVGALEKMEDVLREKIDQTPFPIGVSATLTGLPVLINRIMGFLINDNIRTVGLAIIGVFLILFIYFRSYKIALFSIVPVILTLIWLAGTMHLFDIRITVMIASVGAIMVGMSVDYAIHLTHAYHHNIKQGRQDATQETVVGVGAALFASVATTLAGFFALILGTTPNSVTQGTVLFIGILFAFITTILILPPLMILQRKFIYSKLDEVVFRIKGSSTVKKRTPIDKFLMKLSDLQVKRPWLILIIVGIFTILVIPGFGLVYLDTDDENWVPDDDDVVDAMGEVGTNFGGTESMNLLFMIDKTEDIYFDSSSIRDLRDPRVIKPMSILDNALENIKQIDLVESPTNDIRNFNDGRVPQDFENIKKVIEENPQIKQSFNEDFSIAKVTVRAALIERPEFYDIMEEVNSIPFPKEISIVPQGPVPRDIELESSLGADTMRTSGMGFVFVIIVASLFYLSIVAGFLAFIPIVFAIIWTIGSMGWINLPFTVLTTGMLAILMGIGIDFSIHIIHSVKRKMAEVGSMAVALPEAMMGTGQAITITTITTVLGFMILSLATLINTKRLGWTLALGILMTFFACILIVPSVLVIQDRLRERRKKRKSLKK